MPKTHDNAKECSPNKVLARICALGRELAPGCGLSRPRRHRWMEVVLASYALLGPAWQSPLGSASDPITWTFGSPSANPGNGFSDAITDPAQQAQVEAAIQTWAQETGLNFKEVPDTSSVNPDIIIGYGDFNSTQSGILGQTNYSWSGPIGGGQNFNSGAVVRIEDPAETPLTTEANGSMWYQGIVSVSLEQDAMHEFGHALGLASNPSDQSAVMYDGLGASNQTLNSNDIAAIQALYSNLSAPGSDTLLSGASSAPTASVGTSGSSAGSGGSSSDQPGNRITFDQNNAWQNPVAGNTMFFINGSNNLIDLSGGSSTVTENGSANTFVLPGAGTGSATFNSDVLAQGDSINLQVALHDAGWDGSTSDIGNYISVNDTSSGATISAAQSPGGSFSQIAYIPGETSLTLKGLLAHAVI